MMKIGILQTGEVPDEIRVKYGQYPELFMAWLADPDFEFETFVVEEGQFPERADTCDAWLITGSRHGAYEDHDWIPPLEDLIRDAFAAVIPVIGICFGHQIIAQALGGKVEKFSGGWSVGVKDYVIDGISRQDGDEVPLNAFHQDQVIVPPENATVIGASSFCRYAALRYGDIAFSIQPHPEFTKVFMSDLVKARGDLLPAAIAEEAMASLDKPLAADRVADFVKGFLKRAFAAKAA